MQKFSLSYSPKSQGIVERFNREMKELIETYRLQHHTIKDKDAFDKLILNYNNRIHTVTHHKPVDLLYDFDGKKLHSKLKIQKPHKENILSVGDHVRVSKYTIPEQKRAIFQAKGKRIPLWSKDIYVVSKVFPPRQNNLWHMYQIKDLKTGIIRKLNLSSIPFRNQGGGLYSRSQLLKIPK